MTAPRRTYWHLEGRGRVPSEYEIVTSKLLPCASKGFAVRSDVVSWIERYQHTSGLVCADWDELTDPRATTYASYVELRQQRTIRVQSAMAPSGRLAVALAFQTTDAIRVVQHLAERVALLRRQHTTIARSTCCSSTC